MPTGVARLLLGKIPGLSACDVPGFLGNHATASGLASALHSPRHGAGIAADMVPGMGPQCCLLWTRYPATHQPWFAP